MSLYLCADVYENRGEVCLDQGQPDQAIHFFRLALARESRSPKSLTGIGKAYVRKGDPAQAARYLAQAIAFEPDNAAFHYQLGQAYLKSGRREEGTQELTAAQQLQDAARNKQAEKLSGKLPLPPVPHP
jgi:tetratricopeptide (TPR) repeat protein